MQRNAVLISTLTLCIFGCLFSCKHDHAGMPSQKPPETTFANASSAQVNVQAATVAHDDQSNSADEAFGMLVLPDGSKFQTTLYELKLIGQLKTQHKLPYYILSGRSCPKGCDANISIYIHSPSDGPMKDESAQPRFYYPGHETYYEDGTPIYEARMFFGDCAAGHPNAALWFQRFFGDDKQWHPSVFVAAVTADVLSTEELHRDVPNVKEAEQAVRSGRCREVPGIDRTSEP